MICPTCKKEFEAMIGDKLITSYPFCRETCKMVDLYFWVCDEEDEVEAIIKDEDG